MAETLHTRIVKRACDMVGGYEALAERLGLSRLIVKAWLTGKLVPSRRVFFDLVDILHAESRPGARPATASRAETRDIDHT